MSELDTYLVVGFFSTLSAFFTALGYVYLHRYAEEGAKGRPAGYVPRSLFYSLTITFCTFVGFGYFIAWICFSHQTTFKLIPVFIFSALVWRIPPLFNYDKLSPWFPLAGMISISVPFHLMRHMGLI